MTSTRGSASRMGAVMSPSPEPRLRRFTAAERWTHRTVAVLVLVLLISAACLYLPAISSLVGNRALVKNVHIVSGFALPIPLLAACGFAAFRLDVRRLNRFTPDDWAWLRNRDRRSGRIPVGKFNAGQKLNSAFQLGAIIVLFATGSMMFFNTVIADELLTGATFVHDWLALAMAVVVAGHTYMALKDPMARTGMRTGEVSPDWAQREHGAWAQAETEVSITPRGEGR